MFFRLKSHLAFSALISALFCYLPNTAMADEVVVKVPEALNVMFVNDEAYKRSFFSTGENKVELKPGLNRLVLEYETLWDLDAENHEVVKSEPVMVSFSVTAGTYEFSLPEIKDVTTARAYASKPELTLVNSRTKQPEMLNHSYRSREKAFLASFQDNALPTTTLHSGTSSEQLQSNGELPLTMLRYWWQQATAEQRQAFIQSVGQ